MVNKLTWISTIVLTVAISNISAGITLADSSTIPPTSSCADAFGSQLGEDVGSFVYEVQSSITKESAQQ